MQYNDFKLASGKWFLDPEKQWEHLPAWSLTCYHLVSLVNAALPSSVGTNDPPKTQLRALFLIIFQAG